MKLENKHIIPYLNHNLKILANDLVCEVEGIDIFIKNTVIAERINYSYAEIKLVLHPFKHYSTVEGITDEMTTWQIEMIEDNPNVTELMSYEVVNLMFKHHIDYFGLIPAGLAINKNNIK